MANWSKLKQTEANWANWANQANQLFFFKKNKCKLVLSKTHSWQTGQTGVIKNIFMANWANWSTKNIFMANWAN